MPNASRCAASATNDAATVGVAAMARAPSTSPRATATRVRVRLVRAVRPEAAAPEAGGEHGGQDRARRRRRRSSARSRCRPSRRAAAARSRSHRAERRDPGARRRGEDVGLHEVPPRDDVRQRGREPGQHEPADPGHGQRRRGRAAVPRCRRTRPRRPPAISTARTQVRDEQHAAAVPPVQQRSRERPDHRVRAAGSRRARPRRRAGRPRARG